MKTVVSKKKEPTIRVRVGQKNPSLGITVCHRSASLVMPNDDPRDGFFYQTLTLMIHTHYHNSNLIWRTVSRRVDEVIPSDHPRRVASRVIQWYGLIHLDMFTICILSDF